jgi:peptidoglycan/xylan/chitin deacetylase (PgdA/CDA1 family)
MKKLLLLFLLFNFSARAQQKISWPNHKKAVIVLSYDDAINSQLDIAIPQLDSAGLTATFFLAGNNLNSTSIPRWRAAGAKGYELANHTLYHPCISTTFKMVPEDYSENYTVYSMIREISMMNSFLFAIDGNVGHTYAYPCTQTVAGGKSYVDTLRETGIVRYARSGGDENAVVTNFKLLDPLQVPSWGVPEGQTGAQLIAFVKKVQNSGGMGVFMFHGVGGDYITTSAKAHKELLDYLVKNKSEIWVATFQQALDYAAAANRK